MAFLGRRQGAMQDAICSDGGVIILAEKMGAMLDDGNLQHGLGRQL